MRVSPKLLVVEIFAFIVFAILAGAGFLAWRLSQGPIDLEMIRPGVERSLTEARGRQPVKIENLVLEWVRERNRIEVVAKGFTALDRSGRVAFRAQRAMIALDAGALAKLQFRTRQLRLEGGKASVIRSKDGVWTLADLVLAREPDASEHPFDPIRDINWPTLATPIRALISAGDFESVELSDFHLDVDDQKSGSNWSADPVSAKWTARREGVALNLEARLTDALDGEPNRIQISLASDGAVTRAAGQLTLLGVDPVSVVKMFGYAGDAVSSGKPASATFAIAATERGGLQSTKLSLANVTGSVRIGEDVTLVRDLAFDAAYDPATKLITLEKLKVDSDKLAGEFTGTMDASAIMAGDETRASPFRLSGKSFVLGLMPVFEAPWPIASAEVEGSLSPDLRRVSLTRVSAETGELNATGSGELWLEGEGEGVRVGVRMEAVGAGRITPQQVTSFWPVQVAADARDWVRARIQKGVATRAVFAVNWPPGADSGGFLPDENLSLDFTVQDASVRFLDDFPPITGVSGIGHLKGNSLAIDVSGGRMGNWQVDEGHVVLPRFGPKPAAMDVRLAGRGGLGDLMRVLDKSSLRIGSRYGLMVDQMSGSGSIDVRVKSLPGALPDDKPSFAVKGGFVGASAPDLVGGFGLRNANVNFDLTETGMALSGAGELGPAPVTFEWKEGGAKGDAVSTLVAKVRATPDLLNAFGVAARNIMQGEAVIDLRASGSGGRDFSAVTANVDLTRAKLDLAEFGWTKKVDAPAKGSFRYGKSADGSAVLTGDVNADGLELSGEGRLDAAGAFQSVDIERIYSRDTVDLHGTMSRQQDGGYRLVLSGPYFDASPWIDTALDLSGAGTGQTIEAAGAVRDSASPVFDLLLTADRLRFRQNADLTAARVALSLDDSGPRSGRITGVIAKGKGLDVVLSSVAGTRTISVKADDAGFGARVLLNADYLVGGKLSFDGRFRGADGDALVKMSNVRLKNAPLLAQIFSLASLQGLADVLAGEGVLFTEVNAPVKFAEGRIDLPGLRATGPAMGITARGWIAPDDNELSLDGVLAPSFIGANQVLGALPIIGDLFVSRQGEGMFAPTYSVRGTFSRARVQINPVAALTPGILRQIFENPSRPPQDATATPSGPGKKSP